jgi:hypothetical protein
MEDHRTKQRSRCVIGKHTNIQAEGLVLRLHPPKEFLQEVGKTETTNCVLEKVSIAPEIEHAA